VDPTLGGSLLEHKPKFQNRALNTVSGNLDWKTQFDRVLVPTVYSKVKWVRRKLHPMELLSALDVLPDVQGKIIGGIAHCFTSMPIPGKLQTHVLRVVLGKRLDKKRCLGR
jgi:hypothetical protein